MIHMFTRIGIHCRPGGGPTFARLYASRTQEVMKLHDDTRAFPPGWNTALRDLYQWWDEQDILRTPPPHSLITCSSMIQYSHTNTCLHVVADEALADDAAAIAYRARECKCIAIHTTVNNKHTLTIIDRPAEELLGKAGIHLHRPEAAMKAIAKHNKDIRTINTIIGLVVLVSIVMMHFEAPVIFASGGGLGLAAVLARISTMGQIVPDY